MANKIALSTLNASTIDILNTIRANASAAYRDSVPQITKTTDIPTVGDVLYGYPALANEFIGTLVNRIAAVRVKSAVFYNRFSGLKKGFLEFGETIEEVFVNIAKAREFSTEKAAAREFKRTLPDVKVALHAVNWRVQYPITIERQELKHAFLSVDGVSDLIARIVNSVYTAAEYDEYLLMKYLIIKSVTSGKMYPVEIDTTNNDNAAIAFRGFSNSIEFMSSAYNAAGVTTATPREDQIIIMDAKYNAEYDVTVLASAFNMDKANFMGNLYLVDDFTTFDNARFSEITENTSMLEEVTAEELALMANVRAVMVDREWFQIYDDLNEFSEKYVASGLYWNYFYNIWKVVSSSPFSNAIVFVDSAADTELPVTLTAEITDKSIAEFATTFSVNVEADGATLKPHTARFIQTEDATGKAIGVHEYGGYLLPATASAGTNIEVMANGVTYSASEALTPSSNVGDTFTLSQS